MQNLKCFPGLITLDPHGGATSFLHTPPARPLAVRAGPPRPGSAISAATGNPKLHHLPPKLRSLNKTLHVKLPNLLNLYR
jgi:hypothetical protein